MFALLGASAMIPIFHSIGVLGWARAKSQIGAQWFVAEGLALLAGVLIFVVSLINTARCTRSLSKLDARSGEV